MKNKKHLFVQMNVTFIPPPIFLDPCLESYITLEKIKRSFASR